MDAIRTIQSRTVVETQRQLCFDVKTGLTTATTTPSFFQVRCACRVTNRSFSFSNLSCLDEINLSSLEKNCSTKRWRADDQNEKLVFARVATKRCLS